MAGNGAVLIANLTTVSRFVDSFVVEMYTDAGLTNLVASGSCGAISGSGGCTQASAIVITGLSFGATYYSRAGVVTPVTGTIAWSGTCTVVAGSSTTPSSVSYSSTLTGTIGGISVNITPSSVPTDINYFEAVWVTDGSTPASTAPPTWTGSENGAGNLVFFVGSHTGQTVDIYVRATNTAGQSQSWTHLGSSSATADALQQQSSVYGADTGTANAYAVTLSPAPTIVAGSVVVFLSAHANTGASTLAVNGGSASPIKKQASTALVTGDILSGELIEVVYDGTNWQMQTPASNSGLTALTGDVTATGPGSAAAAVTKINGTSLAALGTGIVKNTTGTGVPSIAVVADFPTLNQDTTGTAANLSGTPALPNGTTATTQTTGDNSTKIATTAFVLANSSSSSTYFGQGDAVAATGNDQITIGSAPIGGSLDIFVAGAILRPSTDYTLSGLVVSLASALTSGQVVVVKWATTNSTPGSVSLTTSASLLAQSASGSLASSAGVSVAYPSANTAGNLLVAVGWVSTFGSGTGTVTDTNGNTWTQAIGVNVYNGWAMFYARNVNAGNNTVTISGSGGTFYSLSTMEFNVSSSKGQLDVSGYGINSGTAAAATAGGGLSASEIVVFGVGLNGGGATISTPSGYTVATPLVTGAGGFNSQAFYCVQASGTPTATSTLGSSSNWETVIASFKQ